MSFYSEIQRKKKASANIQTGDLVVCVTHEYKHLLKGEVYKVSKVVSSYKGNRNLVISDGGNTNTYWAGNFIKSMDNNVSPTCSYKKFRYVIYDDYGNIEYQSNCIRCINTYVNQNEKENHIC